MSEWLYTLMADESPPTPGILAWRIGSALALGVAVTGVYRWARRGEPIQATFVTTLVLLAALIAMVTQVIGDNVARAFSLVGALSVVRFRTVVKDTQDTAFVIFAVVVGMAAGANDLTVALVGVGIIAAAGVFLWSGRRADPWAESENGLSIRHELAKNVQPEIERILAEYAGRFHLTSAETSRQGASLDLAYAVRLRPGMSPAAIVRLLNAVDGVQSVGLQTKD
jgi:hypothetical protein